MFKNIFLPPAINNYYIFGQRIIGLDIRKTKIVGTQIYLQGNKVKIEKIIVEKTFLNTDLEQYIQKVLNGLGVKNEIRAALPNSLVIFKQLALPFVDQSKLTMVLPFEVESLLPFKLDQANLDFIITDQNIKDKRSDVLVSITKNQHINYMETIINKNGATLSNLSVDFVAIYSLLKESDLLKKNQLLIDLSYSNTTIGILDDNRIKEIRTLNKGLEILIQEISNSTNLNNREILEKLERSAFDDFNNYIENFTKTISNEILFTLNAIKDFKVDSAIITNSDIEVDLTKELSNKLQMEVGYLDINLILNKKINKKSDVKLKSEFLNSIAIAIPTKTDFSFNLLKTKILDKKLIKSQLLTGIILIFLIISSLLVFNYFKINHLASELEKSNKELTSTIKNTFEITDQSILKTPSKLIEHIRTKVNEEESLWFAFSKKTRFSFLKYLEELSSIIDTEKIGLNLNRLSLSEGTIEMSGNVPGFDSLKELESALNKSNLFNKIGTPQETDFNITLQINKNKEA